MSQAGIINVAGGGGGGSPIQTLTGDTGAAAEPVANNINILTTDETANNTNGIRSESSSPTGDDVTIFLTNRITGTGTTTDDSTLVPLFSFDLGATPGTYLFQHNVIAYNVTDTTSLGYVIYKVVRTDGASGTGISSQPGIQGDEDDMVNALVQGAIIGNTVAIRVRGLAGKTINWYTKTTYDFIG